MNLTCLRVVRGVLLLGLVPRASLMVLGRLGHRSLTTKRWAVWGRGARRSPGGGVLWGRGAGLRGCGAARGAACYGEAASTCGGSRQSRYWGTNEDLDVAGFGLRPVVTSDVRIEGPLLGRGFGASRVHAYTRSSDRQQDAAGTLMTSTFAILVGCTQLVGRLAGSPAPRTTGGRSSCTGGTRRGWPQVGWAQVGPLTAYTLGAITGCWRGDLITSFVACLVVSLPHACAGGVPPTSRWPAPGSEPACQAPTSCSASSRRLRSTRSPKARLDQQLARTHRSHPTGPFYYSPGHVVNCSVLRAPVWVWPVLVQCGAEAALWLTCWLVGVGRAARCV